MAHMITRTAGKHEFAFTGQPGWHGLGQKLPAGADLETWQTAAGMDWRILRGIVRYATERNGAGMMEMPDQHVLFRSDTKAPLSVVSDGYQAVQPGEVLGFFRDLADSWGFKLDTAGTLSGGRRFWALAKVAEQVVRDHGDKVRGYLLLATSADGSMATTAKFVAERVVCHNTISIALSERAGAGVNGGRGMVKVSHRSIFDADAVKAELGLKTDDVRDGFESAMDTFRRLASTRWDQAQVVENTLRLFGHDPDQLQLAGKDALEKAIKSHGVSSVGGLATSPRHLVGSELAGGQGTAWGWLNAVTQYVDHHARQRAPGGRLNSSWFGEGDKLKSKALELAVAGGGTVTTYSDAPAPGSLLDSVLAATPVAA